MSEPHDTTPDPIYSPCTEGGQHLYLAGRCVGCDATNRATAPGPYRFADNGPTVPAPTPSGDAIDVDTLRAAAREATAQVGNLEGPWEYDGGPDGDGIVWARDQIMGDPVAASCHPEVATYIATFDPPTVLALLDQIESLRRTLTDGPMF